MIKQQELDGKIYKDRECIGFRYVLVIDETDDYFIEFNYRRVQGDEWECFAFMPNSGMFGDEVFRVLYDVPHGSPLDFIAAVGLNSFAQAIEDRHEVESVLAMHAKRKSTNVLYKPSEARHA